jgi:NAD(P)-dependent dehydrogenase (short-subunit alcohol dehydrogenase family)
VGELDGRVALVTGGARGQGRSHALAIAAAGATVVVCDIAATPPAIKYPMASPGQLEETVQLLQELGQPALGLVADMRDTEQVQSVVDRVLADFGKIDILVANHGLVASGPLENTSDDEWDTVVDSNLTGIFKVIRAVVPHMKSARYGRIVATSSMGARIAPANLAAYVSAKWGVIGLVKVAAVETGSFGITVNAICPGALASDLLFNQTTYDLFCPDITNPTHEDFERRLVDLNYGLNGRSYLQPEHSTRAVMYLVTDNDGVVSGQVMDIGLGHSAKGIH